MRGQNNRAKSWLEAALAVVFIAFIGYAFISAIGASLSRGEQAECLKWQKQAQDYPLYYSAKWQIEQCKAHGIELPR